MLGIDSLDAANLDEAATVIATEHRAARAQRPGLPADGTDQAHCREALADLLGKGHFGVVARQDGRCVGVLIGCVMGTYAALRADGLAVDPQLDDPTTVLATLYAELAPTLLQRGTLDHYATHVALPALGDALNNLGFGRSSVYAVRPPRPRQWSSDVEIRIGTTHDLDTITNLSYIEMKQRFEPPIYSPPHPSNQDHARAYHAGLLDQGALHFIARRGGHDVGLVTVEFVSRAPRLCPDGQPYIGSTATHPSSRGRGVGHALVDAALDWAYRHDFHSVSVDFQSANPLSRPFWLGAGFRPTGYGITRSIHPSFAPKPGM